MKYPSLLMAGFCLFFFLMAHATPALAAPDERDALKKRFEERYPKLVEIKKQGRIGETAKGLVEAVKKEYLDDAKLKALMGEENTDRLKLYELLAVEMKISPEKVAERNAIRYFEKAKPGDYLQDKEGKWYRKPEERNK